MAIHARLTRLGANFIGPAVEGLGNPDLTGNIEIDFYNIGLNDNDSRSAIRMRRAFLDLDWGDWSLIAGQEWDIISPLVPTVNHDLSLWGAGNLGDRRPQLRVQYDHALGPGSVSVAALIGFAGAVDSVTVEKRAPRRRELRRADPRGARATRRRPGEPGAGVPRLQLLT